MGFLGPLLPISFLVLLRYEWALRPGGRLPLGTTLLLLWRVQNSADRRCPQTLLPNHFPLRPNNILSLLLLYGSLLWSLSSYPGPLATGWTPGLPTGASIFCTYFLH